MDRPAYSKQELLLLLYLFMVESSFAVTAMAMHMQGDRPFGVFLSSKPGMVFVGAIIALLIAGGVIVSLFLAQARSPFPQFRLVVTMNLVTVLLIVLAGEIFVRVGTQNNLTGETFLNVPLKPRQWDRVREQAQKVFEDYQADSSVLVPDDRLGWTVGMNRYRPPQGEEPSYASSAEGLRAPRAGVMYDPITGKADIALIGDSYTFGDKVSFEETWGNKLDQLLGDDYRVLNFGVPGYGLGQAYQRYMRDAAPTNAKVVLFSFIDDDLMRTMRVYPFVFYSSWRLPFSKPRFVLEEGELNELNQNPVPFTQVLSTDDISELPFIRQDIGYRPNDWEEKWYHFSYLIRLITSRFPAWSDERPEVSKRALLSINTEIIKRFIQSAEQSGSIPLIMWFPAERTFEGQGLRQSLGKQMLEQAGIPYIDPTPCLTVVDSADRFVGGHYSPQGNTAVANCVLKAVKKALAQA